ncbi:transposase, partial [Thiolapillus sp.]|uniref:transposase n=1 Tax=Thiolapillus sp. TaxID=2017437 RepID=UPI003AF63E5A
MTYAAKKRKTRKERFLEQMESCVPWSAFEAIIEPYYPQACLRPRDRFWDIPVPKIDSAFDNLLVPQPSWSPSTTQQLRKLVAAPYLAPNDWTPRSEAYFVFPLAQGTPGKQCGLAATGVYQPSLRSPWLAAKAGKRGGQPIGLSVMLRIYLMQQWFNLSDPMMEDALYEIE